MDEINSEILRQFKAKGLVINEGIAVDARLVKSASRPLSNEKLKEAKEKCHAPEGKLDKNGKPKKFSRDLDSDWLVQKDTPHFGLKEHASADTNHGFILATTMTPCSVKDTNFLSYCTVYSRHTKQPIKKAFADKGYAGKPNGDFLVLNNIADGIMRKHSTTAKLTEFEIKRNKKISKPDISSSSTLESATCTIMPNRPDSQTLLKTNLMDGIGKRLIISQRD